MNFCTRFPVSTRLAGFRPVIDAGLLEQLIEDAALLQPTDVLRQRRGGQEARQQE
jgi:hypothetical protein